MIHRRAAEVAEMTLEAKEDEGVEARKISHSYQYTLQFQGNAHS